METGNPASMTDRILSLILFIIHVVEAYLEAIYRFFIPVNQRSLTGEIILVTGSANGFGKAICQHLSQFKVTLVLWDCDKLANYATTKELQLLETTKARIFPYHVDISSRDNVEAVAAKVKEDVGDVSIIINNAGIAPIGPFLSTDPDLLEKTFQVNVLSHFWILRVFLPRMIENHHGHIATVSSIGAFKQDPGCVPYFGTKAAVHGYIESLKLQMSQLNAHGIKFTTIYPYFMDTGMIKEVKYAENSKLIRKLLPIMNPADVAEKFIEGIRRNYEYVYCPSFMPYLLPLDKFLPLKLRRELQVLFDNQMEHPAFPRPSRH
ncbi:17-beta-hydroxysteroid dehydrogenase 13 [Folsomia candida]|uniref:Short-chain dehydrogenase/reductase 3 n=1 Tax=Folsomia candida TaxID=158441 RepID=A0A226EG59_FOLCA|nr:17-beta-hydroxysteroid dehydrogenase 13 [Folsomia candida]OXA56585.1 Epidermal retinol dehydrogenase 2 [Folsomia candida]